MQVVFSSNGKLRELIGSSRIRMEVPPETSVKDLLEDVAERFGVEARTLILGGRSGVLVAVNGEMIDRNTTRVADGDEVTVLLPMAGG